MSKQLTKEEKLRQRNKERAEEIAKEFKAKMQQLGIPTSGATGGLWNRRSLRDRNSLSKISPETLAGWLQDPKSHEKDLRGYSLMLYNLSGEYRGLINYFSSMARFYHMFEYSDEAESPNIQKVSKELSILSKEFSKMQIQHEFSKIFDTVLKEDVFYGYEIEDKHSFFLLKLDPDYCKLSGQSDGMWLFKFDFSYFNGSRTHLLDSYPPEFKRKYTLYTHNKSNEAYRWQSLDFAKSVCFKFNENQTEIVPPLASTFEGISELNEYRRFKKANTKIQNYLLLHQKVPIFDDSDKSYQQNNFMIDSDTMMMFHNMLDQSLPEEIGAVVSPMDIEAIKLEQPNERADRVAEATRDVYNAAGVNQYLFNPDKNSTAGLSKSIKKDEMLVIKFYLQVSRWLNRRLVLKHPKWKHWSVKLLSTTGLTEHEYAQFLIQLATLGFPVVGAISSMLGYDHNKLRSMNFLENEVLDLKNTMIPLASSHTGGINDQGGRPEKSDTEISESGQANRDSNEGVAGGEK